MKLSWSEIRRLAFAVLTDPGDYNCEYDDAPALWPKDPVVVSQEYDARPAKAVYPGTFMWEVWTAEGSDYLEALDARSPGRPVHTGSPHPDLIDISHVRWATGNAITSIDLCAATLGRLFCRNTGRHEFSLRSFDPACAPRSTRCCAEPSYATAANLPNLHPERSALPRPSQRPESLYTLLAPTPFIYRGSWQPPRPYPVYGLGPRCR